MLGHQDYQTLLVIPNREYYNTLIKDLGILPNDSSSLEDIQNLTKTDHRLITAIHYMFVSNRAQFNWSRTRGKQIQEMKNKIKEELKKL